MPRTISEKARRIAPSATLAMDAKAKALKAQGVSVVSFAAGEPDFDTPLPIRNAMKEAMDQNMTRYTPVSGTAELKEAIIHRFEEDHGLHYDPQEIIVSNGAKHSLYTLFQTLLDPGDEVIIPTPCWVSYPEMVRMAGGTPIFVEMKKEHGFVPTNGEILAAITPRTKAFLLTSPNNPTGCVWNRKQMENVMQLAIEHDFYIVSDEIYEKLLYTGEKPCSIASLGEEAKAHTLVVNGVSKSYAMTGFRIGYTAGPRDVIKAMTNYQSQATSAPNSAAQHAAAVALSGDQACVETTREAYRKRRDILCDGLTAIGWPVKRSAATMFVWAKLPDGYTDSVAFSKLLLDKTGVLVTPGAAFGPSGEGHVRMALVQSDEEVLWAIDSIKKSGILNK